MKGAIILATVVAAVALGACRKKVPHTPMKSARTWPSRFADALVDHDPLAVSRRPDRDEDRAVGASRRQLGLHFFGGLSRGGVAAATAAPRIEAATPLAVG